ncbi:MAG: biotin--[acetyl-CoA-carboxylase] ligase [Winogradskyella sp.]|uniref:biotin--[acetyl-CoA-carboxylase] ligase n=1 Tax=Winogradskyella sp. TaxID=1883156 RepID=UPI000F40327C|nr:biotin--[acetyl-CoA-carboxylase] ligase [Winogradskyella sp.]RNC83542.1 MAG: biotin--[acetyl-CoA-carboxylase] ligase [Winogradskyella sp.]
MNIIKLNAIDSTSTYLKRLSIDKTLDDYTVVVANYQTNGRGQMGAEWQSESSKNLTFSVFKDVSSLSMEHTFCISMAVSLALVDALKELQIPKLKVKWPNDILSENKKIAGVLIENVIKNNTLDATIIGVGLNVNQKFFNDLPQASSMTLLTGIIYDKNEVLNVILRHIKNMLSKLKPECILGLKAEYELQLFRLKKPSTFVTCANNKTFSGFIEGVTTNGKLKLLLEDEVEKTFDLKEVKLLY